jgi:hypothetical protein
VRSTTLTIVATSTPSAEAFREKVFELTGERDFSYRIAVTRLQGDTGA